MTAYFNAKSQEDKAAAAAKLSDFLKDGFMQNQ